MSSGGARAGSGRKRLGGNEESKSVFVKLPMSMYKTLQDKAFFDNLNISEYVRRLIAEDLRKPSVEELENNDETLYEALSEFIESCHRTDKFDKDENIDYFMRENGLSMSERNRVELVYDEIAQEWEG